MNVWLQKSVFRCRGRDGSADMESGEQRPFPCERRIYSGRYVGVSVRVSYVVYRDYLDYVGYVDNEDLWTT